MTLEYCTRTHSDAPFDPEANLVGRALNAWKAVCMK